MFNKIIANIKFFFWYFIVRPIHKWINLCIHGRIIPENERNKQIWDYCIKCMNDNSYQPSTPVEHWTDKQWRESFERTIANYEGNATPPTYEEFRSTIALTVAKTMSEYANGKVA